MLKPLTLSIGLLCMSSSALASNIDSLIQQCTPKSHWKIMKQIVKVESNNSLYAIGTSKTSYFPESQQEAEKIVKELMSKNIRFDVGLTQINSNHFKEKRVFGKKGFTPIDALEPCINLKMGAYILSDAYRRSNGDLASALSVYNTGHPEKGFINGYVDKYL